MMTPVRTLCLLSLSLAIAVPLAAQLVLTDTTFKTTSSEAIDVDLNTYPNNAILASGSGTNLARSKAATVRYAKNDALYIDALHGDPAAMLDGSSSTFLSFLSGQDGSQVMLDLQATRVVNRFVTRSFASPNFRPRGYTIYLGRDSVSFHKIKQVPDNTNTANLITDDTFDADTARFVLFSLDKMDPTRPNGNGTLISEMEVYGVGYLAVGFLKSKIKDMGRPVNWARASWNADTPEGTGVHVQFRTGISSDTTLTSAWSDWSSYIGTSGSFFLSSEPRRFLQYRIMLTTVSTNTPRLRSFSLQYDTLLVCGSATARLSPISTPVMKQLTLTYEATAQVTAAHAGIDTLVIQTGIPLEVTGVTVNNVPASHSVTFIPGEVHIGFGTTIAATSTIRASLKLTPYLLSHTFPSYFVSNRTPWNPQWIDPAIVNGQVGWTLTTIGVPDQVAMNLTADPNPFTPNGDGKNDVTHFSFFVANLTNPRPVRLKVYDLSGRKVKTILDVATTAQAYVEQNAIAWDGRDDNGRLLPPGVYLYQLTVDTDAAAPAVVTKTVTIAY